MLTVLLNMLQIHYKKILVTKNYPCSVNPEDEINSNGKCTKCNIMIFKTELMVYKMKKVFSL